MEPTAPQKEPHGWAGRALQPQHCLQGGQGSCLTPDPVTQQGWRAAMPATNMLHSWAAAGNGSGQLPLCFAGI